MKAEIISIGDELLIGQVVNTNSSWIAQKLHDLGITITRITTVPDEREEIMEALDSAFGRSDLIFTSGGLGPTNDDITKDVLCQYFGVETVLHEPTLDRIRNFFSSRGRKMIESTRKQAELPSNCEPIPNNNGIAPGMWFEKDGKVLISMPGVPFEMEAMMENTILPRISEKDNFHFLAHKTIQTYGEGESLIMERIREWENALPSNFRLAYLPQPGLVRLRVSAYGESRESATSQLEKQVKSLINFIPDLVFGYDQESLEEVTGNLLRKYNFTLSTAESCTGGYLAHLITSVPGASDYYTGSVVSYSNQVKMDLLGVSATSLEKYGAVSEQVVREMADGARKRFSTHFALATSGVAGPTGGSVEKPVGLVWLGLSTPDGTITRRALFGEHRGRNIRRASLEALNMLRLHLLKT